MCAIMCLDLFYCDIDVLVNNTAKDQTSFPFSCVKMYLDNYYEGVFAGGVITLCVQGMNFRAEETFSSPLNH